MSLNAGPADYWRLNSSDFDLEIDHLSEASLQWPEPREVQTQLRSLRRQRRAVRGAFRRLAFEVCERLAAGFLDATDGRIHFLLGRMFYLQSQLHSTCDDMQVWRQFL